VDSLIICRHQADTLVLISHLLCVAADLAKILRHSSAAGWGRQRVLARRRSKVQSM